MEETNNSQRSYTITTEEEATFTGGPSYSLPCSLSNIFGVLNSSQPERGNSPEIQRRPRRRDDLMEHLEQRSPNTSNYSDENDQSKFSEDFDRCSLQSRIPPLENVRSDDSSSKSITVGQKSRKVRPKLTTQFSNGKREIYLSFINIIRCCFHFNSPLCCAATSTQLLLLLCFIVINT